MLERSSMTPDELEALNQRIKILNMALRDDRRQKVRRISRLAVTSRDRMTHPVHILAVQSPFRPDPLNPTA